MDFAFPQAGRALLPRALLRHFGDDPVPADLARDLGLPAGARLGDIDENVTRRVSGALRARAADYASRVVQVGMKGGRLAAARERLFDPQVPMDALRVSQRTRNALIRHGVADGGVVRGVELRDLAEMHNLGGTSLLQLAAADEELREGTRVSTPDTAIAPARAVAPADLAQLAPIAQSTSRAVRREAAVLARRRWSRVLHRGDPRLGADVGALLPNVPTAAAAADVLPALPYDPPAARRKAGAIRALVLRADRVAREDLATELEGILHAVVPREDHRRALRRRFGWDGRAPGTLEEAAGVLGVTRERVRQIEVKFRSKTTQAWTPALDRALRLISTKRFATSADLNDALREARLAADGFPLASLLAAARLFGRSAPDLAERAGAIVPTDFPATVAAARTVARRLSSKWGASTVAEVTSVLEEQGTGPAEEVVRTALEVSGDIEFLDDERNWFWVPAARNRLLNQVLKVMSVVGSIGLGELRAAVGRHHRMHGFRPPRSVLAHLCRCTGLYRLEGDRVLGIAETLPDWRRVLGRNERLIVETLFERGPVMRRSDLEEIVVDVRGMQRNSFYIYLTYSPILQRYASGVYGLPGAPVSAAEVSAMIPPVVRGQVLREHGWTEDRHPWAVYRLTPAAAQSGVLSAPAALAAILQGQFALRSDGEPLGTVVVEGQQMWGLSPLYRRRGVEPGDHLLLVFDLGERTAAVEVGDAGLGARYQGAD